MAAVYLTPRGKTVKEVAFASTQLLPPTTRALAQPWSGIHLGSPVGDVVIVGPRKARSEITCAGSSFLQAESVDALKKILHSFVIRRSMTHI
jgi:hypothetical protein